jgi:threonine aldolase
MNKKSFASDNYSGIHPNVLNAISSANFGQQPAYGNDDYTYQAIEKFKKIFGNNIEIFFVFNGTAANVLGLQSLLNSYNAIICSDCSHINQDECGAPEKNLGSKLITIPSKDGKISPDSIQKKIIRLNDQHYVQAKIISITQSTEYGTIYSKDEIKDLADFAHKNNLYLHMDGARFANAVAGLNLDPREITNSIGLDLMSFGGTKNGLMCGEAVIFFNPSLAKNFKYIRKQSMQLASKMRFISAQFMAILENELWIKNAKHANDMARYLSESLSNISWVLLVYPVQANAVFIKIPKSLINQIQEKYSFYIWNEEESMIRLMTAFDTSQQDIDDFISYLKGLNFDN